MNESRRAIPTVIADGILAALAIFLFVVNLADGSWILAVIFGLCAVYALWVFGRNTLRHMREGDYE